MQEKYSPIITQSRFENICSSHIFFFGQKFFFDTSFLSFC